MTCPACGQDVLDIDVKCGACGAALGSTGAHRMIGSVMLGQYELVDVLGQGGMSVVFKGRHKLTNQAVALKILPPELAAHSQVKSRFLEEAKALAALDHPNIVHLYNFGQENGYFVLAMQFIEGQTWERMIVEARRLPWAPSCRIAIDVLRALEYAHGRGVVHRDMKPSNVLVRSADGIATVMDFGIAKMTTSTRLTATGQTMGTVRYMSPEQVRGLEVDLRTDLYSLGATLYESLVGDTPFDGATHFEIMTKHLSEPPRRPSALGVELPPVVEAALMRSLAKRADDRFASAREMRKELEQALRDGDLGLVETQRLERDQLGAMRPVATPVTLPPARARPEPRGRPDAEPSDQATLDGRQPRRRPRRRWPWLVLALAVLAGGGATAALLLRHRATPSAPEVQIAGVTFTQRAHLGHLEILTSGADPGELALRYTQALDELRARLQASSVGKGVQIPEPIDVLLSVPAAALCEPSAYPGLSVPRDCATLTAATAIGAGGTHRLMVSDRAQVDAAVRSGVVAAVCDFFPGDDKLGSALCGVARRSLGL
jgi:serine/threonine protein kinase